MGGASAQIAFEPTEEMSLKHQDDLQTVTLRYLDGKEKTHQIYVNSFLGFGANQARKRYESLLKSSPTKTAQPGTDINEIHDPCLQDGLSSDESGGNNVATFVGTGSFQECYSAISPLLNKEKQCKEDPCLFDGVHAPISDFQNHQFIGVSEFWYSTFDVYNLGGEYDYTSLKDATERFCGTDWSKILEQFNQDQYPHVQNPSRMKMQCFKSSYLLNVIHEGLGIPTDKVHPPVLESTESLNGFSVSWTLGVMILFAASTIPKDYTFPQQQGNSWFLLALIAFVVLALLFKWVLKRNSQYHRVFDIAAFPRIHHDSENPLANSSKSKSYWKSFFD